MAAQELAIEKSPVPTHLVHGVVSVHGESVGYTSEIPETLAYPGMGINVPGFGAFKRISRTPRGAFAQEGIPNLTYSPVRSDDESLCQTLFNSQQVHIDTLAAIIDDLPNNRAFRNVPNASSIDLRRIAFFPHSMGGESATKFAESNPSKVEMIIAFNTIGFGSPSAQYIALHGLPGIVKGIRHELKPYLASGELDISPLNILRLIKYYYADVARTIGEAGSCLTSDLTEVTANARHSGVKIGYLASKYDFLVPPDDNIGELVDQYAVMQNMGHIGLLVKADQAAAHATDMRHALVSA